MILRRGTIVVAAAVVFVGPVNAASKAQLTSGPVKAHQLTGLSGVKQNANGILSVENGQLHFAFTKGSADVSATSIEDVVTGVDYKVAVGNTVQIISMAAPYGAGNFLSLFRIKFDTLSVEYRDSTGGLHGAIFTMPVGAAAVIKRELVAQGAHTHATGELNAAAVPSNNSQSKEQKQ
jgi:hypothetical protein